MKIAPFAGTNSLIQEDLNLHTTNVFKTPLIPGPSSSFLAIYTALMRAQGMTVWTCGPDAQTIVSLDLDLYERWSTHAQI